MLYVLSWLNVERFTADDSIDIERERDFEDDEQLHIPYVWSFEAYVWSFEGCRTQPRVWMSRPCGDLQASI